MKWIIDLLIESWDREEKDHGFEPVPLHIEDMWPCDNREEEENEEEKTVIIIDL